MLLPGPNCYKNRYGIKKKNITLTGTGSGVVSSDGGYPMVLSEGFISVFFLRGWRIQWSIVPEVSEPVVRRHDHGFGLSATTSLLLIPCYCKYVSVGKCFHEKTYMIWALDEHWLSKRSNLMSVYKEPPKEDLTVSEKFQLVLDVAQKAQVKLRQGGNV